MKQNNQCQIQWKEITINGNYNEKLQSMTAEIIGTNYANFQ